MQPELEARSARLSVEDKKIQGYAIVFETPSEDLGGFQEVIEARAVDRTLAESLDVRALVDHDTSKILGRTTAGTLKLQKDARGLLVEIHPPDTSTGRDILESVRRGDVSGMSFRFAVVKPGGERFETRGGITTRIISDMRIAEVSVVTFPAYAATDVAVAQRALRAFQAQQPRQSIRWLRMRHATRRFLVAQR